MSLLCGRKRSGGRLFQRMDAATRNERRPTVARRYADPMPEPVFGVMRMRADDDDHRQISITNQLANYYYYIVIRSAWNIIADLQDKVTDNGPKTLGANDKQCLQATPTTPRLSLKQPSNVQHTDRLADRQTEAETSDSSYQLNGHMLAVVNVFT